MEQRARSMGVNFIRDRERNDTYPEKLIRADTKTQQESDESEERKLKKKR